MKLFAKLLTAVAALSLLVVGVLAFEPALVGLLVIGVVAGLGTLALARAPTRVGNQLTRTQIVYATLGVGLVLALAAMAQATLFAFAMAVAFVIGTVWVASRAGPTYLFGFAALTRIVIKTMTPLTLAASSRACRSDDAVPRTDAMKTFETVSKRDKKPGRWKSGILPGTRRIGRSVSPLAA